MKYDPYTEELAFVSVIYVPVIFPFSEDQIVTLRKVEAGVTGIKIYDKYVLDLRNE